MKELIETLKKDFKVDASYMSGVNDGFYFLLRNMEEIITRNNYKNMWIRMTNEKPKHHGAYIVFGRKNIGSPFESREKFTAFWAGETFGWTDKEGDDYNQLNEGIEFWLNISYIKNPI